MSSLLVGEGELKKMKPPAIKFSRTETKRPGKTKDENLDGEEVLSDMAGDRLECSSLKTIKVKDKKIGINQIFLNSELTLII